MKKCLKMNIFKIRIDRAKLFVCLFATQRYIEKSLYKRFLVMNAVTYKEIDKINVFRCEFYIVFQFNQQFFRSNVFDTFIKKFIN